MNNLIVNIFFLQFIPIDNQYCIVMRKAFQMFDQGKTGFIEAVKIATILTTLGHTFDEDELQALIDQHENDGTVRSIRLTGKTKKIPYFLERIKNF